MMQHHDGQRRDNPILNGVRCACPPGLRWAVLLLAAVLLDMFPLNLVPAVHAQSPAPSVEEIPMEHCDGLPVIKVKAAGAEMRFLVDTAATSILNIKSFSGGEWKPAEVSSWKGTDAVQAKEISLPELEIGGHHLHNLRLRALDLSGISRSCGGRIDGILGFELMEKLGITLNLKRQIAQVDVSADGLRARLHEMENAMHGCMDAFDTGNRETLAECFDPEIVLYTHQGEFHGRKQVMEYLHEQYLKYAPNVHFDEKLKDARLFGDVLWYTYDYSIETPREHVNGHGMAMCRRNGARWRILNMHNSLMTAASR